MFGTEDTAVSQTATVTITCETYYNRAIMVYEGTFAFRFNTFSGPEKAD